MAKLSYQQRKKLPNKDFVFPGKRAYPIEDAAHARNALARGSANASPSEQADIRAKVRSRFPGIGKKTKVDAIKKRASAHGA